MNSSKDFDCDDFFLKLYEFQKKYLSAKQKKFIESIDSGIFTGKRDNDSTIKSCFLTKNLKENIIEYYDLLECIEKININFFYENKIDIEKIPLYRGISTSIEDEYIDLLPTSFSYKKEIAINFSYDNGTVLNLFADSYIPFLINLKGGYLNEYEVILPPTKYISLKILSNKHTFDDGELYKYKQNLLRNNGIFSKEEILKTLF